MFVRMNSFYFQKLKDCFFDNCVVFTSSTGKLRFVDFDGKFIGLPGFSYSGTFMSCRDGDLVFEEFLEEFFAYIFSSGIFSVDNLCGLSGDSE